MGRATLQLLMKLYSYIVARDFGFAPNPFFGYCTLATCKPKIRAGADVGDWIVGTGAKTRYKLAGRLIFAMKVSETLTLDEYWRDSRFCCKKPVLNGSLKQIYGDNIYHRSGRRWYQEDSHHSLDDGTANQRNVQRDTSTDRMLIATTFVYFGSKAVTIPQRFRPLRKTEEDLCCRTQGHRVLSEEMAGAFADWLKARAKWGVQGLPLEFSRHKRAFVGSTGRTSRTVRREQK